jgi:hypothetical protein
MVRSQAREPRHDARQQREAASCNEDSNRCNEKPANNASGARSAAESTQDSLQRSGAAISHGCQGQEGERETDAVERQQQRSASRVASRCCDSEDRPKDDTDAGCPGDGEGGAEQEAAEVATTQDRRWRAHTVELWNAQDASKVQAANHHGNANGNLQDRQESPSGTTYVAGADAEGYEDHAKASGEEEGVTHA